MAARIDPSGGVAGFFQGEWRVLVVEEQEVGLDAEVPARAH